MSADVEGAALNTSLTASIQPQFQTIDGLKIRYADTGGPHDSTLLLTSPWPESLYAFAPIWATLAQHARLFAVDLPGFGASERRDDLLSPRAMGGFLARLVADVLVDEITLTFLTVRTWDERRITMPVSYFTWTRGRIPYAAPRSATSSRKARSLRAMKSQ